MQWFADNWQLLAALGVFAGVILTGILMAVSKLTPSTTDDQWAVWAAGLAAKAVKLTPTLKDDELLAALTAFAEESAPSAK
jgi:hypothetical protein